MGKKESVTVTFKSDVVKLWFSNINNPGKGLFHLWNEQKKEIK